MRERRGGPITHLVLDVLRQGRRSGNWLVIGLIGLVVVAVLLAAVAYVVVPSLIYPAL